MGIFIGPFCPKQKRRKGIDIIPPIESERGPSPVFRLPMEGESLESEFEELKVFAFPVCYLRSN